MRRKRRWPGSPTAAASMSTASPKSCSELSIAGIIGSPCDSVALQTSTNVLRCCLLKERKVMLVDEEVVLLEEQLASAHADLEQLQARLTTAEALTAQLETDLGEARRTIE